VRSVTALPVILGGFFAIVSHQSAGPPSAPGKVCEYEENCQCAVPGITIRWKAAYCMFLNETDDLEHEGVGACLARPDPKSLAKADPCARNAHWKRELCAARQKFAAELDAPAAIQACVEDPTMIPPVVRFGPGGGVLPRIP
jgi:hypothetical protein